MDSTRGTEPDSTAVVRALFDAHNEGRIDDLLRLVDPGAVWETATRPGRDFYLGKDGALGLFSDIKAVYGEHRIDVTELEEVAHGQVRVSGTVVRVGAGPPAVAFTTLVSVRDGRVVRLLTLPEDLRDASPDEQGSPDQG